MIGESASRRAAEATSLGKQHWQAEKINIVSPTAGSCPQEPGGFLLSRKLCFQAENKEIFPISHTDGHISQV